MLFDAPPTGSATLALLAVLATLALPTDRLAAAMQEGKSAPEPAAERSPLHDARGYPFRPPESSAVEPRTLLAPVRVSRSGVERWEGLVQFGEQIPLWLERGDGPESLHLAGAASGGVFGRFSLEAPTNEFVEAHFHLGLQLRARYRAVAARLELYHVSSHLGDEYLERTGRSRVSTSREGAALLFQTAPLPSLTLHGGPGFILRSSRGFRSPTMRAGFEWQPLPRGSGGVSPYVAGEAFGWSERDWDPMLHLEAGLALGDGRYNLGLLLGSGPARAEQFFREGETLWGLVFTIL